ncbi:MAG: FAD-binding protein [Pelagibacteraceae bacterium]|tara:strand:- start:2109 stop:3362 length:1254 start_codon:yes stop_codon:yes gene_type:complete
MEEKQNFQTYLDFNQTVLKPKTENEISEVVRECYKKNIPLEINGSKSKNKIGKNFQTEKTLDMSSYSGIIDYKPEELYIKAKAGTSLEIINNALEKNNQQLAFEPTDFGCLFSGKKNLGTIGGVMACNFAGPRRFKVGSVRDHVLGFKGINGKGEIIKSGGTVVKNVTGYDLSKILSGSFGTLAVLSEIAVKVLPKSPCNKTLVIDNPHIKKALEYLNLALSSSSDCSGGVFYPEIFRNYFSLNDLTIKGALTAIRIEGPAKSVDKRIEKLMKEINVNSKEVSILEPEQSNVFWKNTQNLNVFSATKSNLLRIVSPPSETFDLIQKLKKFDIKYFIDWGGNLVWLEINKVSPKILREITDIVRSAKGYLTVIKIEEHLKAQIDIFAIDSIKYKITEKIKKSFDPRRILNPGKMYIGI